MTGIGSGAASPVSTRDHDIAASLGASIITAEDSQWPTRLTDLEQPPQRLWTKGERELGALMNRSVSVVGARAASPYGEELARELSYGLAKRGFTIVSGAAFGIDRAAHEGALAAGGATVALLACGIDRPYPQQHADLLERIAANGAVATELPPGSLPLRQQFLIRNRLIAALTRGTLVVQAGLRSGSLNTARWALDLGRIVAAVPGPVTSPVSAGCHRLIRDSAAILVSTVDEAVDAFGDFGEDTATVPRQESFDDDWSSAERAVFDHVPVRAPRDVDSLVTLTRLAPQVVLSSLARLELDGLVRSTDAGWQKVPRRGPLSSA